VTAGREFRPGMIPARHGCIVGIASTARAMHGTAGPADGGVTA
jgi:hypothetical protein